MTRTDLRRILGWTLVFSLTVAALSASVALVNGDFDETDGRVIGTSLGFAVFSSLAGAGGSMRLRARNQAQLRLGEATVLLAALSFLLLLVVVWIDRDSDAETLWRLWGCCSVVTLAASHGCLVTGARRTTDGQAVRALSTASIALGIADATGAILPLADLVDDWDEGLAEIYGVLLIALLLTTALPPIVRRLSGQPAAPAPAEAPRPQGGLEELAHEAVSSADRIEGLADGNPQIARECQRLRGLAKYHLR